MRALIASASVDEVMNLAERARHVPLSPRPNSRSIRYRGAASFPETSGEKRTKLFVRQKRFDFEKLSYRFPAQFSQVRPSVLLNSHNFNTKTVNLSTVL